jgi:hypothetical protein
MHARKRPTVFLAVIGAVVSAVPVASATTATTPATALPNATTAAPTPECPVGYVKNLATGCAPWWVIAHGVPGAG